MPQEIKNTDQLIEQVNTIITTKLDEVHKKYEAELAANGKVSDDTRDSLKKMSDEFASMSTDKDNLRAELNELAQKLASGFDGAGNKIKTVGRNFVDHENFAQYKDGNINKMSISVKNTILTESGSPQDPDHHIVAEDRLSGIVPLASRSLNVMDVIPMGTTTSDTIKFSKELSNTNAAAPTAQGAQKPESSIVISSDEEFVRTIPTFLKVSKQALDDAPMLESFLNTRLGHMVRHKLQTQIISGDNVAPNLGGLTSTGNHTIFTPSTGDLATDSLSKAKYAIIGGDYEANVVLMNPADWGAIERTKVNSSTDNRYAFGDGSAIGHLQNGIQPTVWGMPVVLSNDVSVGYFIMMDRFACQLFMRENLRIEMFEQDGDNVQKNLLTIRAELRAAFAVYANAPIRYGALTV